jgi:MinD-like ATPase involved in chromosome partitioning or flagellar assembly
MVRTINRPLREPKVIGVTAPKGGVAKTTVLSMVAVVAARLRPACRIVAVDTDHNGGLALRAEGRQPSNILEFAKAIQRGDSDRPNFMAHTIDGVDILGSSPSLVDPPVTPEMWQVVLDELKNRYDLIFVDMSIMQATETYAAVLQSLDGLIIVATPTVEATRPLGEIPRWLDLNKAPHLKSRRTTVFTKIDTEPDEVDVVKMIKYEHDSGIEAAAVPFDPHLRAVTNLAFDEVDTATKKAFVTVAASAIKNVS